MVEQLEKRSFIQVRNGENAINWWYRYKGGRSCGHQLRTALYDAVFSTRRDSEALVSHEYMFIYPCYLCVELIQGVPMKTAILLICCVQGK